MRKCRGPDGVIFDTPKKMNKQYCTRVNNGNVAQTLTNDLQAMSGGLCVTLDVWKEEDTVRMQLHTDDRTSMVFYTRFLTWNEVSHS